MDNNTVLINLVVGTVVVPPVVEFLKVRTWSNNAKRLLGLLVCFIIAAVEFYVSGHSFESFAITGPVLFAMATGSYHLFFQNNLGALENISPLGALLGGTTNEALVNTVVTVPPAPASPANPVVVPAPVAAAAPPPDNTKDAPTETRITGQSIAPAGGK